MINGAEQYIWPMQLVYELKCLFTALEDDLLRLHLVEILVALDRLRQRSDIGGHEADQSTLCKQ